MIEKAVNSLVEKAKDALDGFLKFDQKKIDKIVKSMALAAMENRVKLAKLAVEETKRGIVEDKVIKNMFASEYIYNSIKNEKTVGIIDDNEFENYTDLAEPIGVVAGITPVTNPTSTTIFKSLICAKTRNPIIFAFHPSAQKCCVETVKILIDAGVKAGAPEGFLSFVKTPSIEATSVLMNHHCVSLVLATGGGSLVKAAYSTGKPALGVGPGNVPCYIEKTADLKRVCNDLIISKTFDNGMICASEQAVIVDEEISEDFENIMKENNCYFLNEEETKKISDFIIDSNKRAVNPLVVGKSAYFIAKESSVEVPKNTKILIIKLNEVSEERSLLVEKLSPVLAYCVVKSSKEGFEKANQILELGGLGHSACIHSENEEIVREYGIKMRVGRIIVNAPSSHGAIGDIYNVNIPSLTLGCGSYGKNSVSTNVSAVNLINKKRIAKRRQNVLWFKIPPKIYFENNSISYLANEENIERVFIVTDKTMMKLSYLDKIAYFLKKNRNEISVQIFSDVFPDPDTKTVLDGVKVMKSFEPDTIIALGGGSVIDAAKAMQVFYEDENASFDNMKQKFMDIEKRIAPLKKLINKKTKLIAIPTTSGTGSEITSFMVIVDRKKGIKYPLADYEITPDVAIIDPQFVMNLPRSTTADTGMDVLTHAIEAYVSVMANDYTDALALKAIELVFNYLEKSYENGANDPEAREKMHNASAMAGMAFTNAFLGLNHSMAHTLGGEFHIPHGRANAILLPYVIEYNSNLPTKFTSFPNYKKFIADKKYERIAKLVGVAGNNTKASINNLIIEIKKLLKTLNLPKSIKECNVKEDVFLKRLDFISEKTHEDQCISTNPRYPLISEIKEIYKKAFKGI